MRSPCRPFVVCAVLAITGCLETPIKRIDQDSSAVDRDAGVDAGPDAFVPQACETNAECDDARASRCGPKNFCIPCGDNVDCEGIFGANVCIPDVGCFPCSDTDKSVCADPTPECHPQTHECVECTAANDGKCQGDTPFCDETAGKCVGCREPGNADCSTAGASVCKENECVACSGPADCTHIPNKPECHPTQPKCVECWDNSHCPASKPVCDVQAGTCGACSLPEHCGRFEDTKVCGPEGACVECTATQRTACVTQESEPAVCNAATNECANDRVVAGTPRCGDCVSDAECMADHACVELKFEEHVVGNYCLPITTAGCSAFRPYARFVENAPTIDGATANVCTLRYTTCEAHESETRYGSSCGLDASNVPVTTGAVRGENDLCGHGEFEDAFCIRTAPGEYRCSPHCAADEDCPALAGVKCESQEHESSMLSLLCTI